MSEPIIGTSVPRVDAKAKATGTALYVPDITLPRMLHAAVVRAGVPHATISGIDATAAASMPGVREIVTGEGCAMLFGSTLRDQPPIAVGKVRHAGEAVAVVLADTPLEAHAAVRKVNLHLEPLPFVLDPRKAAAPGAPLVHERNGEYESAEYLIHPEPGTNIFHHYRLRKGDANVRLAQADVTVEEEFIFPLINHAAIEPHAAICRFELDGGMQMWASTQAPFVVRDVLAELFGLPSGKVRVQVPYVGGGFGGKSDVTIEPLVAYAASFVPGFAVKLVLSRSEVMTSTLLGRGMVGRMKLGATNSGDLVALSAEMYFADGAYGETGWAVCTAAGYNCAAPFHIPAAHVDVYGVYTNSPPVGAFRGYGHPEGQFMTGRLMDMLARKIDMPHAELLKRNFVREGRENLLGQAIQSEHGNLAGCLDAVTEALDAWESEFPSEGRETTAAGGRESDHKFLFGRGIAALAKSPKVSPAASSGCHITLGGDGSVFVNLGGIEMGQGSRTVFAQMAAESLAIPIDRIQTYDRVDTQHAPWDWQTVASMQTYRGGKAIQDTCDKIVDLLISNAALAFGCDAAEVVYERGECFRSSVPDERLGMGSLSHGYTFPNGLTVGELVEAVGWHRVEGVMEPDQETGMGNAAGSWTFGAEGAQIRIDRESGEVKVLHFAVALDPGRVINPQTARGQVTGGVVQGLGATLLEKIDFNPDGTINNTNFGPYKVPRLSHAPSRFSVIFIQTPNGAGPWGAKALGEHPIVAVAPAVLNAIYDATGIEFVELPVTPSAVKARLDTAEVER